eukprot:SM000150S01722  [mRNA]  locus=s150:361867:362471:+ [translate_table: standard]
MAGPGGGPGQHVLEQQRFFQSAKALTHLKAPRDRFTSVVSPSPFRAARIRPPPDAASPTHAARRPASALPPLQLIPAAFAAVAGALVARGVWNLAHGYGKME